VEPVVAAQIPKTRELKVDNIIRAAQDLHIVAAQIPKTRELKEVYLLGTL